MPIGFTMASNGNSPSVAHCTTYHTGVKGTNQPDSSAAVTVSCRMERGKASLEARTFKHMADHFAN